MSDGKAPTWGYHKTEPAQIFDLAPGEALPAGWADTPAAFAGIPNEPAPQIEAPRRGRKPMPRDASGQIIRETQQPFDQTGLSQ